MSPLLAALVLAAPAPPLRLGDAAFRVGESFTEATLAPDGRHVAVAGWEGRFHLLDADTGGVVHSWHFPPQVRAFAFDGRGRLRVLHFGGAVRTFDVATGGLVAEVALPASMGYLVGGGRYVVARERRPDGQWATTFDCDTGRVVWTVADDATHSDDGRWLLSRPPRPGQRQDVLGVLRPNLLGVLDPSKFDPSHDAPALFDLARGVRVESARLPDELRTSESAWFAPDGRLVFRHDDRLVEVALPAGLPRSVRLEGLRADTALRYDPFAFSPDGGRIAAVVGPRDQRAVAEWDRATGRRLGRWPLSSPPCDRVAYTADGRLRAWTGSGLRLDVATFPAGPAPAALGHAHPLIEVGYARDGIEVHSLDETGRRLRWDAGTGRLRGEDALSPRLRTAWRAHRQAAGCFDADRQRLRVVHDAPRSGLPFTGWGWLDGGDGSIEPMAAPPAGRAWQALEPSGWWFVSGPEGDWIYQPLTGRRLPAPAGAVPWESRECRFRVYAPPASPLALVVLLPNEGGAEAFALDTREPRRLGRWSRAGTAADERMILAPDGAALAVPTRSGVLLLDARTGRLLGTVGGVELPGLPLAFAPDGRTLLCLLGDPPRRELRLVEVATRTARCRWAWDTLPVPPCPPVFRPDGRQLAYPLGDGTVLLLSTDSDRVEPADPWPDLGSADAAVADAAVRALAARPDAACRIRSRLAPADPPGDLRGLLPDLDDDDPARRDAARERLRAVPAETLAAWRAALVSPSAELRRALDQLIDEKADLAEPTPAELLRLRLAEALDRAGRRP